VIIHPAWSGWNPSHKRISSIGLCGNISARYRSTLMAENNKLKKDSYYTVVIVAYFTNELIYIIKQS